MEITNLDQVTASRMQALNRSGPSNLDKILEAILEAAKEGSKSLSLYDTDIGELGADSFRIFTYGEKELEELRRRGFIIIEIPRYHHYGFLWRKKRKIPGFHTISWDIRTANELLK